jgi:hypothetical protein
VTLPPGTAHSLEVDGDQVKQSCAMARLDSAGLTTRTATGEDFFFLQLEIGGRMVPPIALDLDDARWLADAVAACLADPKSNLVPLTHAAPEEKEDSR